MIDVEWWLDDEFPRWPAYNCYVVAEPATNATHAPYTRMQNLLVSVYNTKHGTTKVVGDFNWIEIDPPVRTSEPA